MLHAMGAGEENVDKLAEMARAKLRNKIPELRVALQGRLRDHHRLLIRHWLEQLDGLEKQIAEWTWKSSLNLTNPTNRRGW